MAKKDLLGGFEFKKLDGLNNGIDIPVSNSLKEIKFEKVNEQKEELKELPSKKLENQPNKAEKSQKGNKVSLPRNFDFKGKGIEPMVNVVPTSQKVVPTPKITPENKFKVQKDLGFDLDELGALQTKQEKIMYLAMRGWRVSVEKRRGTLFHYASKYIKRKKERIYLGSINS